MSKKTEPLNFSAPTAVECDLKELKIFVSAFATQLQPGSWVFLNGDLGAGKTYFVAQFSDTCGAKQQVTSPTFGLLQTYFLGKNPSKCAGIEKILHLDLYRIKNGNEICYLGLEEIFSAHSVAFFEWAELVSAKDWKAFFALTGCLKPKAVWEIFINPANESQARKYIVQEKTDFLF